MHRILSLALLFAAPLAVPSFGSRSRTIFERNHGQAGPEVEFVSRQPGITLWLVRDGVVFGLGEHLVRIRWMRANPEATVMGLEPLPSRSHYLIGEDPAAWRTDVPHFGRVQYGQIYPGTDLVYYGGPQGLEFDWKLTPGADPAAIRFRVEGIDRPHVGPDGHLVAGPFRLNRPVAYQEVNGRRLAVEAAYRLEGAEVAFRLGPYDRSQPLVIDPVVTASTYFGGQGVDQAVAVGTDAAGNVYMAGTTASTNLRTQGPIQGSFQGGDADAFVAKFDSQLRTLIYATYLGGNDRDLGNGLAVDGAGNAYVSGSTRSANFPTTAGAFSRTFGGGTVDGFVAKLNSTGSGFVYSTFVGGTSPDALGRLALDATGNVYAVGTVTAAGYPTTPGALQAAFAGGSDAVVTKLDPSGSRLVYSTYLGRSGNERGLDIALNAAGEAYVLVRTESAGFATTANGYQRQHGGAADALVGKLNAGGSALLYLSYLGGSANEEPFSLAVDPNGNVWVTGGTLSTNLPVTPDAPQRTHAGGSDVFLARLPTQAPPPAAVVEEGAPSPAQLFPFLPFVTFEGDANNQQGLTIRVFLNGELWFSISNTAGECNGQNVTGTLGRVKELDPRDGRTLSDVCLPQGDIYDLAQNPDGSVSGAGVGVGASSPTTPGSFQTTYGGALLDSQLWILTRRGTRLEITKTLHAILEEGTGRVKDLTKGDVPVEGDRAVFTVTVRNAGTVTAREVFSREEPSPALPWVPVETRTHGCQLVSPPAIECRLASLDPGQSFTYEAVYRVVKSPEGALNLAFARAANAPRVDTQLPAPRARGKAQLFLSKRVVTVDQNRIEYELRLEGSQSPDVPVNVRLTDHGGTPVSPLPNCTVTGPRDFTCQFSELTSPVTIRVADTPVFRESLNRAEAVAANAHPVTARVFRDGGPPGTPALNCVPRSGDVPSLWDLSVGSPVGDLVIECTGNLPEFSGLVERSLRDGPGVRQTPVPPPTPVNLQFNVFGASPVDPPPTATIDEPPPDQQNVSGTGPNIFRGTRASDNSIVWLGIPFQAPGSQTRVIRITNIRARLVQQAQGGVISGTLNLNTTPGGPPVAGPTNPAALAYVVPNSDPPRGRSGGPDLFGVSTAPGQVQFDFFEPFAGAYLKRIETTGGPEPLGAPILQNLLGFNYFTTSGFTPQGSNPSDPNAPGVATNGTRIVIVINGAPTEVAFTAPGCVDSEAATGSGGRMQARRVDNFLPADYSGGALVRSCDPAAVPVASGNGAVVYEVVGPPGVTGADVRDRYLLRIGANCSPGVTGRMFFQSGLGPLDQGSAQGPVRRYQPRLVGQVVEAADLCR